MKLEQLREFRQLAYQCLGPAKDATFELPLFCDSRQSIIEQNLSN